MQYLYATELLRGLENRAATRQNRCSETDRALKLSMAGTSSIEEAMASDLPSFPSAFGFGSAVPSRTLVEKQLDTFTQGIRHRSRWWEEAHSDVYV